MALLLGLALSAGAACFPSFDLDGKEACRSNADCLSDERCDRPRMDQLGVCLRTAAPAPSQPPSPTTPGGVVPPGASDGGTPLPPGGSGTRSGLPGGGSGVSSDRCDGFAPERFASDPEHCGGCGISCDAPSAQTECVEGSCRIVACAPGRVDANGRWEDGCEATCDDGEFYCRDFENRSCRGEAAQDPGCLNPPELRDRTWRLIRWNAGAPQGESVLGLARASGGDWMELTAMERGNVQVEGRGGTLPDETWRLERATSEAFELVRSERRVRLRASSGAGETLFAGVERDGEGVPTGALWFLLEQGGQSPLAGRDHAALLLNPLVELDAPALGADVLGWARPVQLPFFRYRSQGQQPRALDVPFVEYRDELVGDPAGSESVAGLRWQLSGGLLQIIRYPGGFNRSPDKVIDGAVLPGGELVIGVPRWVREFCPSGHGRVAENRCVPDPFLLASAPYTAAEISELEGVWRLVGIENRPAAQAELRGALVDAEFVVREGRIYGPLFTGGVVARTSEERPPYLEWTLAGPGSPLPEGRVLQGQVDAAGGIGLLWSRGGATNPQRINNAIYLLLRQEP